ncbi:helix-turn-helix domain-containing protein [Pandoraea oxalativorans]|uniref:helix-turn-helix domain-containing protein n=1 Tax=Pandoraea oxalativorans TaxID=573737 RepID=UPI003CCC0E67
MTHDRKVICANVGILAPARRLGNVSQAWRVTGCSRHSFYRFKALYETGGEAAPQAISRRRPPPKHRVEPRVGAAVVAPAPALPACGPIRFAHQVLKRHALRVSPQGVRGIRRPHDFTTSRLHDHEPTPDGVGGPIPAARAGARPDSPRLTSHARAKREKTTHGACESACRRDRGARDTFCVGTRQGVGRV